MLKCPLNPAVGEEDTYPDGHLSLYNAVFQGEHLRLVRSGSEMDGPREGPATAS